MPVLCGILTPLFPNLCSKHCPVSVSPFRHIFVYKSPWLYVALLWSLVCFSLHLKLAIRPPWPEKKVNKNLKISELLTNTCFYEIPKTNSYYSVGFFRQNNVIELKISENSEFPFFVFRQNMWWAGQKNTEFILLDLKKRKHKFQN